VLEILDKARPDAVIETGTFRGITTKSFANHFADSESTAAATAPKI
jgi:hypothetical protein